VIRDTRPGSKTVIPWLLKLLERRAREVVAMALANKMARIVGEADESSERSDFDQSACQMRA